MANAEPVADDRREQMLLAAVRVIGQRGFAETRVADVAAAARVSAGLVIYYFGTRDRLLTEALRYSEELFYRGVEERLATAGSAAERLHVLVRVSCDPATLGDVPGSWVLWLDLWSQAVHHPEVSRDREELDVRWRATIAAIVREGCAAGEFDAVDADRFAIALSSLVDGLALQVALGDATVTPAVACEVATDLCHRWLGAAALVKR